VLGRRLRVLVDPPALESELEEALEPWIAPASDRDEIGFLLQPGVERSTLTVLLDRGGVFLSRQRNRLDAVRDLVDLITSLTPPDSSAIGLSVRAVATGEALTVGSMAGFRTMSNASRDIARLGGELLPTLRTWITSDGHEVATGRRVRRVAVPVDPLQASPTWGQGVASLAATVVTEMDAQLLLETCDRLSGAVEFVGITGDKAADLARGVVIGA
jgi:hypothetical protein